jgi:serine/threonine protein kinase/tetratricopeptide (TPR) repeat protein
VTPERYQRLKKVFQAAADCEPVERAAFLAKACAGDEPLLREVESMFAYSDQAEGFIEESAFETGARLLTNDRSDPMEGRSIGQYKLISEIGHGGMGAVYLAVRADAQFKKQVAIKIVGRGLDTHEVRRRFRYERQILASLDYPNIAKLLDGGTTEEGLPYLVMDHVDGQPIDRYCDSRRLSTTERLRLFRIVCSAVQYAHQRLVIHRDIKPGNILVTEEETPKLLDFGIAKLLDPEMSEELGHTATGVRLMTPDYASPEQVLGEEMTTASDIYSLGVLLFELLTGHRPYRITSRRPEEIARVICEQEPERPSTAVGRIEDVPSPDGKSHSTLTPESVSRDRGDEPERLRRRLSGDLDNIVLMAMHKEPQRRYASVEQLSEDIRRYEDGLPVIARKDTLSYRGKKFIRRHRVGAAASAMVVLVLLAGIAATVWQARVAARERDQARLEKAKAERINGFLQGMLSYADPLKQRRDMTVAEALDDAARRAETELANQPEVLAAVRGTIANAYLNQGRYDLAEPHARSALDLDRRIYGDENRETAQAMGLLGFLLYQKGSFAEAEPLYRRALEISRKLLGSESIEVANGTNNLGLLLHDKGDDAAAVPLYQEALRISRKVNGESSFRAALALNNLATSYLSTGDIDKAQSLYSQAIEILRRLPDPESQSLLATSLQNFGVNLKTKGQYAEAEPYLREAISLRRQILGEKHPYVALTQIHLADLFYLRGDYSQAEAEIRAALEIQKQSLPSGHIDFGRSLTVLGSTLTREGQALQAEPYLREALEIRRKVLPKGHWLAATTEGALGECLTALKRFPEAETLLTESYNDIKAGQGENSPRTTEAARRLAGLYEAWQKPDEAARYRALLPRP